MQVDEPKLPSMPTYMKVYMAFVLMVAVVAMAGGVYVVYLLLAHLGVFA